MVNISNNGKTITVDNNGDKFDVYSSDLILSPKNNILSIFVGNVYKFSDFLTNVQINSVQATSGNIISLIGTLRDSVNITTVQISDNISKTELPATDATGSWTYGQILRGQLQALTTLNTNFGSFLDTINGEVI